MLFLLSLGCTPPVEAPAELDELSAYLYANFNGNGEDGLAALPAGLASLEAQLATQDLTADDVDDRAFSLTPLTEDQLDGAIYDGAVDLGLQLPVAVSGLNDLTLEQEIGLIEEPNQVCIASDTTVWSAVTVSSGDDCWKDDETCVLETTNEFLIDSLSDGWLDVVSHYRMVTLDDGRQAVIQRGWMPTQTLSHDSDNTWDTRFTMQVWIPTEDGSQVQRYYAFYSSVTGVPDDLYTTLVVNGLDEYYGNSVAFVNGEDCDNDRDREYDRE